MEGKMKEKTNEKFESEKRKKIDKTKFKRNIRKKQWEMIKSKENKHYSMEEWIKKRNDK